VTYSGILAFSVGISTLFSGLFFTLIVTRRLTLEEFGTWSLLATIIGYLIISERVISYWNYRQIARGDQVGRTSLLTSTIFTTVSIPVFFLIIFLISDKSNAVIESMILGVVLLPVQYISQTLSKINLAIRPPAVSYGLLVFEIVKIPVALGLVLFLDLGLNGAIITVLIAYIIKISVQVFFAKPKLKDQFQIPVLRRWLKLSWVSIYTGGIKFVMTLDILLYIIITSSIIGVAYYSASLAVANIVVHSALITQGLGPKLLATGKIDAIKENFTLLMYVSIPLLGLAVIFSRPALFALNPLYEGAMFVVVILAFKVFFMVLGKILQKILVSLETVDIESNPKFSSLLKSKLFLVPSFRYIFASAYIIALVIMLISFQGSEFSEMELVTIWALIGLFFLELPYFVVMLIYVNKNKQMKFPYLQSLKYIGATVAFVLIFVLTSEKIINYQESIYDFLPSFLAQLAMCVSVYIGITYSIDKNTRKIFSGIISEFITKK